MTAAVQLKNDRGSQEAEVGRDLRRSLIQPPAQSGVSNEDKIVLFRALPHLVVNREDRRDILGH